MNDTAFDDCAMPEPEPVSIQVPRSFLAEIEAALRTAADSAEERCTDLCGGDFPSTAIIESLPLSGRRLARSFYEDCLHLKTLASDLKKLRQ